VYVDGTWSDDSQLRRYLLPLEMTETFGEPFELQLLDGAGDLVWAVSEYHGISREGFRWLVADDVVVAMRCAEWDADGACVWGDDGPPEEEMVGFDIETGAELWTLPGTRSVPVAAGNTAIVTDWDGDTVASSGYVLVDLVTGERIGPDGDPWPAEAFAQECCGGDVFVNVQRDGGVVVATNMEHVRVWYPPELTTPTVTVELMG
jgi:outer membrane protein assembly factor BamB